MTEADADGGTGTPTGRADRTGGAAILLIGAHAAGRLGVVSRRDARAAQRHDRSVPASGGMAVRDRAYQPDADADRAEVFGGPDGDGQAAVRADDDGATTAANPRRRAFGRS